MTVDYGCIMRGIEITADNRGLRFTRSTGAGAGTWTAALTIAAPSTFPDYIPAGNGVVGYDLFQSLKDAMDAADGTDTYTVSWQSDSLTGMTGRVTIANNAGNTIALKWSDALTTVDPAWFGFAIASSLRSSAATFTDSTGATSYTSPHTSSLWWGPQKMISVAESEAVPLARVVRRTTLDYSQRKTHVYAQRTANTDRTTGQMVAAAFPQLGGRASLMVEKLTARYVHPIKYAASTDMNQSLAVWWYECGSRGQWFLVLENNAAPGFSTAVDYRVCRLDDSALEDFSTIAQRQDLDAPVLYDVRLPLLVVNADEIAAGGA